jgi:hypothetical protein
LDLYSSHFLQLWASLRTHLEIKASLRLIPTVKEI